VAKVIALLPSDATFYLCQPSISRALPVNELETYFDTPNKKIFDHPKEALAAALADSQEDDFVFVGGSTFVVADIL
jgi:dihydrofolate synthase/folylpolyglutamate synthase